MANDVSTYSIEEKGVAAQPVAAVRLRTSPDEMGAKLGEILPEVWQYLMSQGTYPVGPPFTRYHSLSETEVDIEAGLPVAEPMTGEGRIVASQLPGGKVAATWHVGPYETIPQAYAALEDWLSANGKAHSNAVWEIYWTDPGENPDPATWRTEIMWLFD